MLRLLVTAYFLRWCIRRDGRHSVHVGEYGAVWLAWVPSDGGGGIMGTSAASGASGIANGSSVTDLGKKPEDLASLHRRFDELEHAVAQRVEETCAAVFRAPVRAADAVKPA